MTLGEKIKCARKQNKMTQFQLAEFLGIKTATICLYEKNTTLPSLEVFKKICELFELSSDDLLDLHKKNKIISLGEKIKCARKQNNMTQLELAEFLGITKSTVCQYEKNVAFPSLPNFKKICDLFNLSADDLLDLKNKEKGL